MDVISHEGRVIAIVISGKESFPGTRFFTPPEFSQQLGFLRHEAGHRIPPHRHNTVQREIVKTQEVLLVRRGRVKALLYTDRRRFLKEVVLEAGDVILLASGGHGFEMLEDTEMIEVKQGPYINEMVDKQRFEWPE